MLKIKCIPGCNDACNSCDNKQMENIQAGSDTLTPEQENLMRFDGASFGNSGILAASEGLYSDG